MIQFENGTTFETIGIQRIFSTQRGMHRTCLEITLTAEYAALVNAFVDGAIYSIVDDEGNVYPQDEFTVACDIVDKRDGTFVVYMGMKTDNERLEEENAVLFFQLMTGEAFV